VGKWSHLVGKYPARDDNPSTDYQRALSAARDAHKDKTIEELSIALTEAEDKKDRVKQALDEAQLQVTALERVILEHLKTQGIESVHAGGYSLTSSPEPTFTKRDGRALREWAMKTEQEDLLTIQSQTLTNLSKAYFEANNEPPPGVELTYIYTKLLRRKKG
jgi:uncharacterized coiled-coil protein SlyX